MQSKGIYLISKHIAITISFTVKCQNIPMNGFCKISVPLEDLSNGGNMLKAMEVEIVSDN